MTSKIQNSFLRTLVDVVISGLIVGLLMGAIARLWMRWISTDPEFTWGGTLGIVIGFGIFGLVQSIVRTYVRNAHGRWSTRVVRAFGAFFSLPLFVAAGAIMFPTVLTAVLALWRRSWNWWLRLLLGALSAGWILFVVKSEIVDNFGVNFVTFGRISLMIVIYSWIIRALKSTVSGRP